VEKKLTALEIHCEGIVSSLRPSAIQLHTFESLPNIIANFDIVIIALPWTKETHHLFNSELLAKMKLNSILVNIARGKIVDEQALVKSLKEGPLAFAALDVFEVEPLAENSPLFDLPNVLMTPHISGNFPEYTQLVTKSFLRNLERYLSNLPMEFVVDKQRGY
jgi:phosphoglycerate dehydrogenase-like enzyme